MKLDFPPSGHYIVAVSGGVDSVALLHLLSEEAPNRNYRLRVAHFDHGMRPDSDADRRLVESFSKIYGHPFHYEKAELAGASEAEAREARYNFLRKLASEHKADGIITAHHLDDRHETAVLNAIRGTGRRGAATLRSIDGLYRPLLGARKQELIDYASKYQLPWREDSTNSDLKYTRNAVRRELLPVARETVKGFDGELEAAVTQLDELNQRIDSRFKQLFERYGRRTASSLRMQRQPLQQLSQHTLEEFLIWLIREVSPTVELTSRSVQELAAWVRSGKSGSERPAGSGVRLNLTYDALVLDTGDRALLQLVAQEIAPGTTVRFGRHAIGYGDLVTPDCVSILVPELNLKVRKWVEGDRIAPVGMSGRKKLQDLFVDAKIEREERTSWPVVVDLVRDEIVWVPRLALSRYYAAGLDNAPTLRLTHEVL
jgi:tRNA(Ile)-lysidine synthase